MVVETGPTVKPTRERAAIEMNTPEGLKRLLLPLWNGGHRVAWRVGELFDSVANGRFETCNICGRFGPMAYRRWIVTKRLAEIGGWNESIAEAFARKESMNCAFCDSKLRNRRLADVLLGLFPVGQPPTRARSIASWVQSSEARGLRIAEVNKIDGLHAFLRILPGLAYSEFEPEDQEALREDLCALSYPHATFDLVVSSETLEHVPDLSKALSEIHRVLKPGGRHVFTIPRAPNTPRTVARVTLDRAGKAEHHLTPLYHPEGDRGYFVYTEFGQDLAQLFESSRFSFEERFGPISEQDVAQVYLTTKIPTSDKSIA
jgi:SAM-dependent methyltransferase